MAPMDDVVAERLEAELKRKGDHGALQRHGDGDHPGGQESLLHGNSNEEGEAFKIRGGQVLAAIGRRPDLGGLLGNDISLELENGS